MYCIAESCIEIAQFADFHIQVGNKTFLKLLGKSKNNQVKTV